MVFHTFDFVIIKLKNWDTNLDEGNLSGIKVTPGGYCNAYGTSRNLLFE